MFGRFKSRLYPYLIEGTRTGIIMAAGDALAQTAVENKDFKNIDYMRTIRYGSLGFIFIGPLLTYWYAFLDRNIPLKKKRFHRALKKMLVDQCFLAPTLNLYIIALVGLTNKESCKSATNRLRDQYPKIMKNNYMLWPAVQLINFSVVPLKYQVVFAQSVAVIWNCFLSNLLNDNKQLMAINK